MKKLLLSLTLISSAHVCFGMVQPTPDSNEMLLAVRAYSTIINGTKVEVSHDDLHARFGRKGMQDITVLGKIEQSYLLGLDVPLSVGHFSRSEDNNMAVKSNIFKLRLDHSARLTKNNATILVNTPFDGYIDRAEKFEIRSSEHVNKQKIQSIVVNIVEPELLIKENLHNTLEDLEQCYTTVLAKAHELFTCEHHEKSIAFPFLSSLLGISKDGAAKAGVVALVNFLMNDFNKNKYGLIEVVVERSEEVNFFEKYLKELAEVK